MKKTSRLGKNEKERFDKVALILAIYYQPSFDKHAICCSLLCCVE